MALRASLLLAIVMLTAGCAAEVTRTPAILSPAASTARPQVEITQETPVHFSTGYKRVLAAGSKWSLRGTVPQGAVYQRLGGIFTVEGTHVHEAYLVVSGDRLVGFYLPFEQAYSPTEPVPLTLK